MKQGMKIALVAIGRRENQYAREFVEHHLRMGFTHVYIADNNHDGEERFEDVLSDYIADGKVTVVDYRNREYCHFPAYNEIYAKIGGQYDWVAFFDFDEQMVVEPVGEMTGTAATGTVADLLIVRKCDVVLVNWRCYGDNGLVRNDGRPMAERFTEPLQDDLHVQYEDHTENDHVKAIVRGGLDGVMFTKHPHCPEGAGRYETASGRMCKFSPWQSYDPSRAYIRHYITKTAEEWREKMKKGMAERSMAEFLEAYRGRFFKYNERTEEKEWVLAGERTVCIVHYNTPELTKAEILSIRKHGGEGWRVVIFDNSDKEPFVVDSSLGLVDVVDNTQGQLIDFEKELEQWPKRNPKQGCWAGCNYGSVKHMLSVDWLIQHMDRPFVLCDSDILLKSDIGEMWSEGYTACGEVSRSWGNPGAIPRLLPFLCYIDAPECRRLGLRYHDPARSFALGVDKDWYDTGASFLEDLQNNTEATIRKQGIGNRIEHLASGSWRQKNKAGEWLQQYRYLWDKNVIEPKTGESRLSVFNEIIIQTVVNMEHVKAFTQDGRQYHLTAEDGWLIRSKATGRTYKVTDTCDLKKWEVVADPDRPAADATGTVDESKPKTAKRGNRKGK